MCITFCFHTIPFIFKWAVCLPSSKSSALTDIKIWLFLEKRHTPKSWIIRMENFTSPILATRETRSSYRKNIFTSFYTFGVRIFKNPSLLSVSTSWNKYTFQIGRFQLQRFAPSWWMNRSLLPFTYNVWITFVDGFLSDTEDLIKLWLLKVSKLRKNQKIEASSSIKTIQFLNVYFLLYLRWILFIFLCIKSLHGTNISRRKLQSYND